MTTGRKNELSRRGILSFLLLSVANIGISKTVGNSIGSIPRPNLFDKKKLEIQSLVSRLPRGSNITFSVADRTTGEILETYNPELSLPPASVIKTITSFYALENLGPDFRFNTQLISTGVITNGVLDGDLILVGEGDPTLDTDGLYDLVKLLKERGVSKISGDFKVYGGGMPSIHEIDPTQPNYLAYNPSISGMNLNANRVFFQWKLKNNNYDLFVEARGLKARPAVDLVEVILSQRVSPVFEYNMVLGKETWSVAKRALGDKGGRWLPVRQPQLYSGQVFQKIATAFGITMPLPTVSYGPPDGYVLEIHQSKNLREITQSMLKYSDNLSAEALGIKASLKFQEVDSLASSAQMMALWLKLNYGLMSASFVDHSGLSDKSIISSNELVKFLIQNPVHNRIKPLLKEMTHRNIKGKVVQNSEIKVSVKTGTLHFSSALVGYIDKPSGRDLAFSISMSDMEKRQNLTQAEKENPRGSQRWVNQVREIQRRLVDRWCRL
jgi:D-alanyl-D-alanine carboxypeptidase/D-alanyl-D-alanine-endopeptidase (penicillin-binding protein 4)